jgi:hypothetical protein
MTDRNRLSSLLADCSSPASKENAAEMDCADVGDAHGPTLFARGMVVRTEVGRRTLLGFSQRARIEPLLAVRHRRLHGTAGRRIYFGALLLGYYRRQTLVYRTKANCDTRDSSALGRTRNRKKLCVRADARQTRECLECPLRSTTRRRTKHLSRVETFEVVYNDLPST